MSISTKQFQRADRLAGLFQPATVDIFAGLGGWSIGAERAFVSGGYRDRYIDLMVNHWDIAVAVHQANHPLTEHLRANILEVDPMKVLPGRRIAYLHASPDCTDHSKAKGGKPRRKEIRALADVVIVWAGMRRPDVITLENVEEFRQWGPLLSCGQPDPKRRGQEFQRWKRELEDLGYIVDHRELRACDYGTPTTRKRLFIIARCDGKPIIWPEATHGNNAIHVHGTSKRRSRDDQEGTAVIPKTRKRLKPYRTAAECIDFNQPMLSIFATRPEASDWAKSLNVGREKHERLGTPQRPLKPNTQKRLAGGLWKHVLNAAEPFIVHIAHGEESSGAKRWGDPTHPIGEPLPTVTGSKDFAVADVELASFVTTLNHGGPEDRSADLRGPINTVTGARDARAVVGAQVVPFTAGVGGRAGQSQPTSMATPLPTVTAKADRVVAAAQLAPFTVPRYGEAKGQAPRSGSVQDPLPTVTPTDNGAQLAAVALTKNYTGVIGSDVREPMDTVTGVDHHSLLAVHLTNYHGAKGDEVRAEHPDESILTLDTQNRFGAVAAYCVKFRGDSVGTPLDEPLPTITSGQGAKRDAGAAHAMGLSAVYLSHMYTSNTAGGQGDPLKPLKTITSGGQHATVCVVYLTPYYGNSKDGQAVGDPMPTVVSHDRFGLASLETIKHWVMTPKALERAKLVARWALKQLGAKVKPFLLKVRDEAGKAFNLLTVKVRDAMHLVTDILMRMLKPRELARAQGFDDSYIIDRTADGQRIGKADQVKLIGNSVPPQFSEVIVKANVVDLGVLDDVPGREAVPA